jgi:hypothetical protein
VLQDKSSVNCWNLLLADRSYERCPLVRIVLITVQRLLSAAAVEEFHAAMLTASVNTSKWKGKR